MRRSHSASCRYEGHPLRPKLILGLQGMAYRCPRDELRFVHELAPFKLWSSGVGASELHEYKYSYVCW